MTDPQKDSTATSVQAGPRSGLTALRYRLLTLAVSFLSQPGWWLGMLASILTVLGAETWIPERYHHIISSLASICVAVNAYNIQHPRNAARRDRADDPGAGAGTKP